MAAKANGHAKGPKSSSDMNGKANGALSRKSTPRSRAPPKSKGFVGGAISLAARIAVWYIIVTFALRCPKTPAELTADSPRICEPYLSSKAYAAPYLRPYYDTYLAHHVEKVRPYVDRLEQQVYTPAASIAKQQYEGYGAPKVAQAQQYLQSEWDRTLKPQWDALQSRAKEQYESAVEPFTPYVRQASDAVDPYYKKASSTVVDGYQSYLLPAYEYSLPYAQGGWSYGHRVMVQYIIPYVQWAKREAASRFNILYGENVEPQLMRISERLARYRDRKNLEAVAEDVEESSSSIPQTSDVSSATPTTATHSSSAATAEQATTSPTEEELIEEAQKKIAEDLKEWQEKFAIAADKGTDDLEARISEISSAQIEKQAHTVGNALVVQVEEASKSGLESVKSTINKLVSGLPEDATEADIESAYDEAVAAIRSAGKTVQEKGQQLLRWQDDYNEETRSLVDAAIDSTLDVLNTISDSGLGKIGMKWAWMEGVTHKDWSKYKQLKKNFFAWTDEVEANAREHEGVTKAKKEGDAIHAKGMKIAKETANELARLKEVANYKLKARDASDDFATRQLPAAAVNAAQEVVGKVDDAKSAVVGDDSPPSDGVLSSASAQFDDVSSSVSSAVVGEDTGVAASASSATEDLAEGISSASSKASGHAETVLNAAKHKTGQVEASIKGTPASADKPMASQASGGARKVLGGVSAEVVEAREPVYDDMIDEASSYSDKVQSIASDLGERAADVTKAVSEAIFGPSPTQGSVESVTSVANEQYAWAMAAASSALYGTPQGSVESLTSVAADRYAQAVTAASYAIYGTPTPVAQSLASEASSRYDEAVKAAKEHYSVAVSRASEQISGTTQPVHEQMFSSIEQAYSGAVGAANSRLQAALGYTDSVKGAFATPTQGAWESATSVASSMLSQGLNQASAQFTSAKVAVGAEPTPAHQQYMAEAQRRYYEGIGLAHARYSEFMDAASTAIYGTPTPAYKSLMNEASKSVFGTPAPAFESWLSSASSQYNDAAGLASEKFGSIMASASSVAGQTSKSPAQSVLDSASSQYDAAIAAASSSLVAASSKASEAIYGTQTGMAESLASAASSAIIGSETPWADSMAAQASQNWDALISRVSEQVYGQPTPFTASVLSQAGAYGAQATDAAASQYAALQALFSDLVIGKEPDFTESVMSRFSSAFHTGYPNLASSASSYMSDTYASASSVVSTIFTPPPTLEAILSSASDQINAAVDAASVQVYGSEKGTYEQATSSAAEAYSDAASKASEAVYGTQTGYAEAAQSSFDAVLSSANAAISAAIYGTPTGTVEAASSGAASVYSSVSSVVADQASSAAAKVSEAVYGPEQGAVESASNRLAAALESAKEKMAGFATQVVGSASSATSKARDEL